MLERYEAHLWTGKINVVTVNSYVTVSTSEVHKLSRNLAANLKL